MRFALGIDLGGTKIEAQLLGPEGDVVWRDRRPTPQGSYAGTLAAIAAQVADARTALAGIAPVSQISAGFSIGAGTPGTAGAGGLMKNCNSTCLNGRPLGADLVALLGQPVALANDANCLALSEATDGAGAGADVVFAVILGTGVGAGIAVHGRVLQGANGVAGEWGHNPLPWATAADPAWACYCGRSGCIETLLAGPGLAREHTHVNGGGAVTALQVAEAAAARDAAAQATLARHAERLARALASVINLLDPDVIVLAGGLSQLPGLAERVPALWSRWVFGASANEPVRTRLVRSQHGDASGVRGAAWLGRQAAA
ncbi:MAG: ROK family protein [Rubrivivax sp.]|nr:ROK family protein [Rubrivivax sp.]